MLMTVSGQGQPFYLFEHVVLAETFVHFSMYDVTRRKR